MLNRSRKLSRSLLVHWRFISRRRRRPSDVHQVGLCFQCRSAPSPPLEMDVTNVVAAKALAAATAAASSGSSAQRYLSRKREVSARNDRQGRDICAGCRRPRKVCLCPSLPPKPLATATRFVILQHSAERKRRITGTVPLVLQCLSNCSRVVLHVGEQQQTEHDLRKVLGHGPKDGGIAIAGAIPLLLYPCAEAEFIEDVAVDRRLKAEAAIELHDLEEGRSGDTGGAPLSPQPPSSPADVVVLVDGTWSQAKQILKRYPFLTSKYLVKKSWHEREVCRNDDDQNSETVAKVSATHGGGGEASKGTDGNQEAAAGIGSNQPGRVVFQHEEGQDLCRVVKFRSAGSSGYGFRKEPSEECISTLESVAYTLEVLERTPDGFAAADYLCTSFAAMVALQLELRDTMGRPRFVDRKKKTANRRLTPKRGRNGEGTGGGKYHSM